MAENVRVLISEEEVAKRLDEIAAQINEEFAGEQLHLIGILKGSVFIMCELAKRITIPVTMDFMSVSSYGNGTKSSGKIRLIKDLEEPIEGRNVLVIEDIVDSGRTLSYLMEDLGTRGPKVLKLMTLLDKPDRRVVQVHVDYTGFVIPDEFVVGYGLDYAQRHRNYPFVGVVSFDD